MAKLLNEDGWRRIGEARDAFDKAEAVSRSEARAAFEGRGNRERWKKAPLAEREAWEKYWTISNEYFERL